MSVATTNADPTADATFETLLVAHELGGTDLGRRLTDLASDRLADVHARKDARARQAGARFADKVSATGATFVPLPAEADFDDTAPAGLAGR